MSGASSLHVTEQITQERNSAVTSSRTTNTVILWQWLQ